MKRPYYNAEQRMLIYWGTLSGNLLILELRWMQLKREIYNPLEPTLEPLISLFKKLIKLKD